MTCPICKYLHKSAVHDALDKGSSYETLAALHHLHLVDFELHARHRCRASPLAEAAFQKASRQAQLAMIADHARHQLDLAFHDRRPATIRAAARFYFECSAQLNRWIEQNGDHSENETKVRTRERDLERDQAACIALFERHPELVPEWIKLRDALDEEQEDDSN
jgi:hypothetical protein